MVYRWIEKYLTYDSVEISFGGKAVVHECEVSPLNMEKYLVLWGNQADGKSTLIKAAMGLLDRWSCDKRRYPI